MRHIWDFLHDNSGTTTIEYGFIALLISIAVVGSAPVIGTKVTADIFHAAAGIISPP